MLAKPLQNNITAYSIYNIKAKQKTKINPLENIYPPLPQKKYAIIYADPPWDYGGKCNMINQL